MKNGNDVQVRLRGINTVRRYRTDGSFALYRYHRATGRQLKGEPGSAEFIESLAAAERFHRQRNSGTVADLVQRFEASPVFAGMSETTRKEYKRKFKTIDRQWGTCPIASFEDQEFRRDVLDWRDKIAHRAPRESDNLVSALARVGAWAKERGEVSANILADFPRVYRADRADALWLPEHVEAFRRKAPAEVWSALMLAMHTGQREGDLLRLPWSAYDGERITLRQGKGKRVVSIRCTAALKTMLDGLPKRGPLILTTGQGRAWKKRWFNDCWLDTARQANINDLHFHDLRGTAITMLAEAGATVPEIAAVTGHTLAHVTRILETYLARTRHLADAAIVKLEKRLQRQP
jgi:integrase